MILGIYLSVHFQKDYERPIMKKTAVPLFIKFLFAVAKMWKESKCPSADPWTMNMKYTHALDVLAMTKEDILGCQMT